MAEIGVRELKARASEVIRAVRDKRAHYVITYRGRPVGLLLPLAEPMAKEATLRETEDVWEELNRLGEEIGRGWKMPQTSAELLSGMRR
jgi:prevent-host-death family protein